MAGRETPPVGVRRGRFERTDERGPAIKQTRMCQEKRVRVINRCNYYTGNRLYICCLWEYYHCWAMVGVKRNMVAFIDDNDATLLRLLFCNRVALIFLPLPDLLH